MQHNLDCRSATIDITLKTYSHPRLSLAFHPQLGEDEIELAFQLDQYLKSVKPSIGIRGWPRLFSEIQFWHPRDSPVERNEVIQRGWDGTHKATILIQVFIRLQTAMETAKATARGMTQAARIYTWLAGLPSKPADPSEWDDSPCIDAYDWNYGTDLTREDTSLCRGWAKVRHADNIYPSTETDTMRQSIQSLPLPPETKSQYFVHFDEALKDPLWTSSLRVKLPHAED